MSGKPYYKNLKLNVLTVSILLLSHQTFAMQVLQDHDLRQIDGQDGVELITQYSKIDIDQLYWEDKAGTVNNSEQSLRAVANDVKIRKNMAYDAGNGVGNYNLGTQYQINMGSDGNTAGIDFQLSSNPSTISIGSFQICAQTPSVTCNDSIGNLAIQTGTPLLFGFTTRDGLFNKDKQVELHLGLQNINLYMGLKPSNDTSSNVYNQLLLRNLNFNFKAKGVWYIDDNKGLILQTNVGDVRANKTTTIPNNTVYGYADLTRVSDADLDGAVYGTYNGQSAGLNLEFMTKSNVLISPTDPEYTLAGSKGLIRVGANGRIVNASLQVRGVNANGIAAPVDDNGTNTHTLNNVLGYATQGSATASGADGTVIGSSGIGLRLQAEFTASGDSMLTGGGQATTLEIGGAGKNTFGFEFGELQPLVSGSSDRAYFDSGNVYINLANTGTLLMPENSVLRQARFGGISNDTLTKSEDYTLKISDLSVNPFSVVLAIRGMDFQAISKRGRFTSSSGVDPTNAIAPTAGIDNKWGLGLPFYNLNSNIALYTTNYSGNIFTLNNDTNQIATVAVTNSQRIGFAMALSVEGKNADGSKTTSILVIDGGNNPNNDNKPTDYYLGLRNIDMLLSGHGSLGFENGNLNVSLKDLLMVMVAELAGGYLPGAKYKTGNNYSPIDNFNLKQDVLLTLKLKLKGDMNFALVPNNEISTKNGNRLSVIGDYKLTEGAIQIGDPIDDSMIGLDNLSGLIRFNNAIVVNKDNVGFNYSFDFNPNKNAEDVFRVKDINFYPPGNTLAGQRLGEVALTGGRLIGNVTLTPRNN
ncbi:MAG: hypothetical protein LKF82_00770 [Acinetobacter populi]|jgi:hypothetical protein|uniref:DUF6160 family protein n=1 Tax=Acinetobacter populi TaxID=1582270 RepID=UPI002352B95C|nr:DUF6160 family protein [Acinetobacter populi]MCH4246363.1 hypothetical protein [Acinetobacter populi]